MSIRKSSRLVILFAVCACMFSLISVSVSTGSHAANRSAKQLNEPKLFAEGVINSGADEYGPTLAPDGNTIYFTRRMDRKGSEAIVFSRLVNGKWTVPQTAPFSGKGYDKEPFISPDGNRLFFGSTRQPDGTYGKRNRDFDIWMVEKKGTEWSEPAKLGPEVNSSGYDNYPSVAANGNLYFGSEREGGKGDIDLYRSRLVNGQYLAAENLGDAINTSGNEADPYIAPDESYIIFSSVRAGGLGEGDLYVSFNQKGKWTAPRSLGRPVNTSDYEYTPLVSPDKKHFFFSRGWGDIYQVELGALQLKP